MQHPHGIDLTPRQSGTPYRRPDLPARSSGHSTETPSGTARAVASTLLYPYHNLVDIGERKIYNLIDWDVSALSLRGSSYTKTGVETNHAGRRNIQWSIVGYAGRMQDLGMGDLKWLAQEFLEPMLRMNKIPNVWTKSYGPSDGIVLATTNSPIRMSDREWEQFSGVTYHQTIPGQDHWDVGKIDYVNLERFIRDDRPIEIKGPAMTIPGQNSMIQLGDKGPEVERLEQLLKDYFPTVSEDVVVGGLFGKATRRAVRAAQREIGVKPDGFWGPKTAGAFETWKTDLAEAVVNGIKPEKLDPEEQIARVISRQDKAIEELDDLLEEIEMKYTALYKVIDSKDHPATKGVLQKIQKSREELKTIARTGDRIAKLVK